MADGSHVDARRDRRHAADAAWVASCTLVVLILTLFVPLKGSWIVDCDLKYLQMVNIAGKGGPRHFDLDLPVPAGANARLLKPVVYPVALVEHGAKWYCQYPPLFAAAGALFLGTLGDAATRVIPLGSVVVFLVAALLLARRMGVRRPRTVAALALLATPLSAYAHTFWEVLPAAALGTAVLALLATPTGAPTGRAVPAAAAGLLAGLAFALREEYLLFAACAGLVLLVMRTPPRVPLAFAAGLAVVALPVAAFNRSVIGTLLFALQPAWRGKHAWTVGERPEVAYRFLAQVSGRVWLDLVLFVCVLCLPVAMRRVTDPRVRAAAVSLAGIAWAAVHIHVWYASSPLGVQAVAIGALACSPLLLAGVFGGARPLPSVAFPLAASLVYLAAAVLVAPGATSRGFHFGPRVVIMAFVVPSILGGAMMLDVAGDWLARRRAGDHPGIPATLTAAVMAVLLVLGLLDSGIYVEKLRSKALMSIDTVELARRGAPMPVLTDVPWIGPGLARVWDSQAVLWAGDPVSRAEALRVARGVSPAGALFFSRNGPTPDMLAIVDAQQVPPHEVPQGFFGFEAHVLRWRDLPSAP